METLLSHLIVVFFLKIVQVPSQQVLLESHVHGIKERCSGITLTEHFILTTASCLHASRNTPHMVDIVSDPIDLESEEMVEQKMHPRSILIHKRYATSGFSRLYDLGILKVATSVSESDYEEQQFWMPRISWRPRMRCRITGWGKNMELGHINLTILSRERCLEHFNHFEKTTFCGFTTWKNNSEPFDGCTLDLGSPLICNDVLYGLVSSLGDDPCVQIGSFITFVDIHLLKAWIYQKIGNERKALREEPRKTNMTRNRNHTVEKRKLSRHAVDARRTGGVRRGVAGGGDRTNLYSNRNEGSGNSASGAAVAAKLLGASLYILWLYLFLVFVNVILRMNNFNE